MIDAFNDVSRSSLPQKEGIAGSTNLDKLLSLQIGYGNTTVKSNKYGLWAGAKNYANAPFYVDMDGHIVATSIDLDGAYIETGGAAADVNAALTQIQGAKIVSLSITSTQIANDSISTPKLQANAVTANEIATNAVTSDKIIANAITSDKIISNAVTADKILANSITSVKIAAGAITTEKVSASYVYAGVISATQITTGTLTVGGTGAPGAILLRRDASGLTNGNTYLRWEGGSRIWADTSNRIGINSIGSPMYIYVGSSQRIIIPSSGQTTMEGGANMKGNLNVSDGWVARFTGEVRLDTNYIRFSHNSDAKLFTLNNMGLTSFRDSDGRGGLSWGNGAEIKVDQSGKWFMINGNAKEAVVPTSKGYKALYCIEAPEVLFFDFAKDIDSIDPMFLEVTEGKIRTIKTEEGELLVIRARKGFLGKRFEDRSEKRFHKNNKFWSTPEREEHATSNSTK